MLLPSEKRLCWISWAVLGAFLGVTLAVALLLDRSDWPSMVGDETTYAMQASSLAVDGDLRYSRGDYDRFVQEWRREPENLILQSRDQGATITFGKPFLYALATAPFLRLSPQRGAAVANALFLALAAVAAGLSLQRRIGPAAALWVAVFIFASVAWVYVFWIHADLFLMAATAGALALAYWSEPRPAEEPAEVFHTPGEEPRIPVFLRWFAVGLLLGIPAAFRPFHLALLLPAALAVATGRRGTGLLALGLGASTLLFGTLAVHSLSGGSWMGYGPERQGFYSYTGYPDVDFPGTEWSDSIERWGNSSWIHREALDFEFDRSLWGWNGLYFLVGRHVGVLPYFLPLLVCVVAFRSDASRWALVLAVVLIVGCFFLIRPFNFWGGAGAVGNRYFLPLYAALWFLPSKRLSAGWAPLAVVAAGIFLWPLWREPLSYPLAPEGGYRHVSLVAARWLPYETSQSHLKPAGREDVVHNGLWLKFLNRAVWAEGSGESLRVEGGERGEFLLGSPEPLDAVWFEFESRAPTQFEVTGGEAGETLLRPDGRVGFKVLLERPRARHPMWWTWDPFFLYQLRFRLPGAEEGGPPLGLTLWPGEDAPAEGPEP